MRVDGARIYTMTDLYFPVAVLVYLRIFVIICAANFRIRTLILLIFMGFQYLFKHFQPLVCYIHMRDRHDS